MTERIRISPSKIDMVSKCGVQAEFYLAGHRSPPGFAMLVGRAVDSAISEGIRRKALGHGLPTVEETKDLAAAALDHEVDGSGEIELSPEEAAGGVRMHAGRARDRSVRLAAYHRLHLSPRINAALDWKTGEPRIQHSFEIEMETEDGPVLLTGRTDFDTAEGGVIDLKTSGRMKPTTWAHTSPQLSGYALKRHLIDGFESVPVRLDVLVDRKPNNIVPGQSLAGIEHQIQESTRSADDFQSYLHRAASAAKVIRSGAFMPARPEDWWCSKKFCGYFNRCPFAARPRSVAIQAPEGITPEDMQPAKGE